MSGWFRAAAVLGGLLVLGGCREGMDVVDAAPGFHAVPEALDFGPTALHTPNRLEVVLENQGLAAYSVYALRPTAPNVRVDVAVPFEMAPGVRKVIAVEFTPDAEGGVEGVLEVETDAPRAGVHGMAQLSLKGLGVRALATLDATAIAFGNVELNTAEVRELKISNPTAAATQVSVALDGVDSDQYGSSEAGTQFTLQPGQQHTVNVGFSPTRLGAAEASVLVRACASCEPERVALSGTGVATKLEITPLSLDFGSVPVGSHAEQKVSIRNLGTTEMDYSGAAFVDAAGGVFTVVRAPALTNNKLPAGGAVDVVIGFDPTGVANYRGMVQLKVGPAGVAGPKLTTFGAGGAACVTTSPRTLDFGKVPPGMTATQQVTVSNQCKDAVEVSNFQVATATGGYFSLAQGGTFLSLPSGSSARVALSFTPKTGSTTSRGSLGFDLRMGAAVGQDQIGLAGALATFAPCSYQLSPSTVDFANVAVGTTVTRALTLTNTGASECFVSTLKLVSGSDAAFTADALPSQTLAPGAKLQLRIAFRPTTEGLYGALAEAYVNGPSGHPTVSISGNGVQGCFTLQPATVDFGVSRVSCGAQEQVLVAYNRCSATVTVTSIALADATSGELSLQGTTANVIIPAGRNASWTVRYTPADEGDESAAVVAEVQGLGQFSAGVLATGSAKDTNTDRFSQELRSKVDVLFVIDNSGSMMEEQQSLAKNFAAFMSAAQAQNIDYHLAVTTTGLDPSPGGWAQCPGGVEGGENGRLFPADNSSPRIITPDTANAAQVFAHNVQVGWCHWNEQGLDGAYRALSTPLVNSEDDPRTALGNDGNLGFLRPDAKLAVIFVTDEEDFSTQTVSFYDTFFRALKGGDPGLLSISAIVGPEQLSTCPTASSTGSRYIALARSTGGVVESICTPDWAQSLQNLSGNAFGARRSFRLSETPSDVTQLVVTIDGAPVTGGWRYDASTNSVVFDEAPAAGSTLEITYPVSC